MSGLLSSGDVQSAKVALSGDGTVVAALAGFRIRVLGFYGFAGASGAVFKFASDDGAGTVTDISGLMTAGNNENCSSQPSGLGYFETIVSESLKVICTGALNGVLRYQYIR